MQSFSASPAALLLSFWRSRGLIGNHVKRDVIGRYRGSFLGILWSVLNPVLMLAVYTFVFSAVFQSRWSGSGEAKTEFALLLFAGLIVFNFFAECFNRAPGLVLAHGNYVKKVVFPLEILPLVSVASALFHALISIAVWIMVYVLAVGIPHFTFVLFPLALIPLILLLLGLSWWLAALGVYLRDVGQVAGVITTMLMFLSPIFFPIEALPEDYRPLLAWNPLAPAIALMRDLLFWGVPPRPTDYLTYLTLCAGAAWLGFAWFQKTRKGFADVL